MLAKTLWLKIDFLVKNRHFGQKSKFCSKIAILGNNKNFAQNRNFGQKSKFWPKIEKYYIIKKFLYAIKFMGRNSDNNLNYDQNSFV